MSYCILYYFFLFLHQKCPISQVLTHSYAILTRKPAFCAIYTPLIRFRSKSKFLPTLPIEYDHCAVPHSLKDRYFDGNFIILLLIPEKQKMFDYLLNSHRLDFHEHWDYSRFRSKIVLKSISQGKSKTYWAVSTQLIFTLKESKEAF